MKFDYESSTEISRMVKWKEEKKQKKKEQEEKKAKNLYILRWCSAQLNQTNEK